MLLLVVDLLDGSPGTIRDDATDGLGAAQTAGLRCVLDPAGLRGLRRLVRQLTASHGEHVITKKHAINGRR